MAEQDPTVRLATLEAESKANAERAAAEVESRKKFQDLAAKLERDLTTSENEKAKISADLAASVARQGRHDAELDEMKLKLEASEKAQKELREKFTALETQVISDRVTKVIKAAIRDGKSPALFEGYEKDPAAWMKSKFNSFEAFESIVLSLPTTSGGRQTNSGAPRDGDADGVSPERARELRSLGLDPRYASVRSEADLVDIRAAAKPKN